MRIWKKAVFSLFVFFPGCLWAQTITLGTYPFGDAAVINRAFTPVASYLSDKTGLRFRLVVTRDYAELSQRLADRTVDFAWIGSANYVKTRRTVPGIRYMATYREWKPDRSGIQPYYQAVILTLKTSGIESLSGLRNARFAFTSRDSTSGYAYPLMILNREGIVPERFFRSTVFLGTHGNVVKALVAGSIDAGAISDGSYYNALRDHADIFNVLVYSEPIPLDAFIAAPGVNPALRESVTRALVDIGPDHPINESIREHLGWPAAGFEVRSPGFYDSVDRALSLIQN